MDLLLIRHGEAEHASPKWFDKGKGVMDPPLTERGLRQVLSLAPRLAALRPALIVSSDLRRAAETADALRTACDCPRAIDPAFREIDMANVLLNGWTVYPEERTAWLRHESDLPYPGGENGLDVWTRCRPSLDRLTAMDAGPVAIVAHGGTIRCIVCGLLGLPQEKRFRFGSPLENTSLTWIRTGDPYLRAQLHIFNDFSHLNTAGSL